MFEVNIRKKGSTVWVLYGGTPVEGTVQEVYVKLKSNSLDVTYDINVASSNSSASRFASELLFNDKEALKEHILKLFDSVD